MVNKTSPECEWMATSPATINGGAWLGGTKWRIGGGESSQSREYGVRMAWWGPNSGFRRHDEGEEMNLGAMPARSGAQGPESCRARS